MTVVDGLAGQLLTNGVTPLNGTAKQLLSSPALHDARAAVYKSIDEASIELRELNCQIHSHPELCYQEFLAHDALTSFLERRGFTVTRHAYGLETSFEAQIGSDGPLVVYCAEYDALPGIGHACGHNLIATASMSAFIGLAGAVQKLHIPGRVRILGTPAEEGGGGKVKLIHAGAFSDDIAAAIMAHPGPSRPGGEEYNGIAGAKCLASHKLRVEFTGKSAHAAAAPWNGLNALDAAVAAYANVSLLRQQIRPDERLHGVIEDGGTVPNVIPEYTRMNWSIRSPTIKRADALLTRVKACFEAAATATGCDLGYIPALSYNDLRINETLCKVYVDEMEELGRKVLLKDNEPTPASTDMGNVSYTVPSLHAGFSIPSEEAVTIHHPSFAKLAGTDIAHAEAISCGKGMAMLGWRVLTDPRTSEGARRDFLLPEPDL